MKEWKGMRLLFCNFKNNRREYDYENAFQEPLITADYLHMKPVTRENVCLKT
jgi:hypothetical protein